MPAVMAKVQGQDFQEEGRLKGPGRGVRLLISVRDEHTRYSLGKQGEMSDRRNGFARPSARTLRTCLWDHQVCVGMVTGRLNKLPHVVDVARSEARTAANQRLLPVAQAAIGITTYHVHDGWRAAL